MNIYEISGAPYTTSISTGIRETAGVIPATQSIHIIAIAVVVGSALVTDLRLAGVLAIEETPRTVFRRYLPWIWAAIAVLLATGAILVVGEPNRVLPKPLFWTKMALVVLAFGLTLLFRYPILHPQKITATQTSNDTQATGLARAAHRACSSRNCGRWIAYAI